MAGRSTLITTVQGMDAKSLRNLHDSTKSKLDHAVIVLAGVDGDKVSLIASVAKDFTSSIKAGDIIKHLATELGGKVEVNLTWHKVARHLTRSLNRSWQI